MFSNCVVADFPRSVMMKELFKLADIFGKDTDKSLMTWFTLYMMWFGLFDCLIDFPRM